MSTPPPRAVVIGGSFAGQLAALALARSNWLVTVVDRDARGLDNTSPRGVPQAQHPHTLMHGGLLAVEALVPGFRAALSEHGGLEADFGEGCQVLFPGGWSPRIRTGIPYIAASRSLVEHLLRERLRADSRITAMGGTAVGINWRDGVVCGVYVLNNGDQQEPPLYTADLVVDASGRTSALSDWLTAADRCPPEPRELPARLTYASRLYQLADAHLPDWLMSVELPAAPAQRRGGFTGRIEGDRVWVTLIGAAGERPPADEEAFAAYATGLGNPRLSEVIASARPLGSVRRFGPVDSRWHLYHRMRTWPDGLIALGDAVAVLNPIYAHGLSVAARQALSLHHLLSCSRAAAVPAMARAYQRQAARHIRLPWILSTLPDSGWLDHAPVHTRAAAWAVRRLLARMPADPALYRRFVAVQNLAASPTILLPPLLTSARRGESA
ncbi:hypothetical protein ABZ721_23555 [Streptomyces sp. NPDC006733]|uniref:hypothetical protein n=1 Tax=Streptomyces sp. NPDC006733 TaxID=3155460 RepID=UPI0033EECF9B